MPIFFKGDGCPYVMARVGGLELEFLLDTGSSHSFINTAVFQDLERRAGVLGGHPPGCSPSVPVSERQLGKECRFGAGWRFPWKCFPSPSANDSSWRA